MWLDDRTAIVTGAGSGIGREIALALARQGARVVGAGRRRERLEETATLARESGGHYRSLVVDVTDRRAVDTMVADVLARERQIDILVNNAGALSAVGALWELDCDEWWSDVVANLRSTMLCTRAVLPAMMARDRGTIVNLDGGGGADGANRGASAYGSSKAAVARLTETVALELKAEGSKVQVLGINPGFVRSSMTEGLIATERGRRWQNFVAEAFATGRTQPASASADAILKLLSVASPGFSGRIFNADDDFERLARDAEQMASGNWRVMRLRPVR